MEEVSLKGYILFYFNFGMFWKKNKVIYIFKILGFLNCFVVISFVFSIYYGWFIIVLVFLIGVRVFYCFNLCFFDVLWCEEFFFLGIMLMLRFLVYFLVSLLLFFISLVWF